MNMWVSNCMCFQPCCPPINKCRPISGAAVLQSKFIAKGFGQVYEQICLGKVPCLRFTV